MGRKAFSGLSGLDREHGEKRAEAEKALEILARIKQNALFELQKTRVMLGNLTPRQRGIINRRFGEENRLRGRLEYTLETIDADISAGNVRDGRLSLDLPPAAPPGRRMAETGRSRAELRYMAALKQNLVHMGIILMRTHELALAIEKSTALFNRQYRASCRRLFPLGIVSRLWRNMRRLFRAPYFSHRDLGCLENLGATTGCVLRMVYAPLF